MTDLEIVNAALVTRLGQAPVSDFSTGIISKPTYDQERDELLRKIPWNFARKFASLAQLIIEPLNLTFAPQSAGPGSIQYTAAYRLPEDCLRLYRVSPYDVNWRLVGKVIYTDAVPAGATGEFLGLQPLGSNGLDNQPASSSSPVPGSIGIEYIARISDPNMFDPQFTAVFIWKLAKVISFGISGLANLYQIAASEYNSAIADASAVNGMENLPDEFFNTQLTDVRLNYSSI